MKHSTRLGMMVVMACGIMAVAAAGWAQDPQPDGVADVVKQSVERLSWDQILASGSWPMKVIIGISVFAVALVIYLMIVLRAEQVVPRRMHQEVLTRIADGHLDEARLSCSHRPSPFGAVALAALNYVQSVTEPDATMLKDVMESEGRRQAASIQDTTHYLLDVAAVAPMIGLLGTVIGMFQAFQGVAAELAQARPVMLASGVSMALITTAAGLIVGIPAMMFYAFFRGWAAKRVAHLEVASMEVLTAIIGVGKKNEISGE